MHILFLALYLFTSLVPARATPIPANFLGFQFMGARIPAGSEACKLLLEAQNILGRPLSETEVTNDLAAILENTGEQLEPGLLFDPREEGLSDRTWIGTPKGLIRLGEIKEGSFVSSYDPETRALVENQVVNVSHVLDLETVYREPGSETLISAREGQLFYAAIPILPLPKLLTPARPRDFTALPGAVVARISGQKNNLLIGEKLGLTRALQSYVRYVRIRVSHKPFNFIANGYLIPNLRDHRGR